MNRFGSTLLMLAALLVCACSGASVRGAGTAAAHEECHEDDDCEQGLQCYCRGSGEQQSCEGMSSRECAEASCGGRICAAEPPRAP
ncbi:MAG TPA: hypothetical protein RMH99_08560 [Sandaracinaceae bacterium LLY-WYZ-13_1]|nr:hypothetical protein [Sandaracinaceae bacterium LLY-WYZ-13_1]